MYNNSRQPLRMENSKLSMDGTGSGSLKFKVQNGFFVPRWLIAVLVLLFIGSLIAVGLLVYYLAPRPFAQQVSSTGTEEETLARSTKPKENVLLPKSLKPVYYEVQLQPFLPPQGNSTFDGHVLVSCHVQDATNVITMHVNNISIDENSILVKRDSQNLDVKDVTYNKDKQFVSINLKKTLEMNSTVNVSMAFIGHLNDDMCGFYRSSYKDKNQNTSWLAVTQFQPTDARRAFPCFDEPDFKARFNITLIRPTHMTSISNMPIAKTIDRNDSWSVDNYQTTVAMSTYLLAFVVSDFHFLSNNASNTQFRVWARPEAMGQVEYALSAGPRALDFFQQYFNVPFPLPKQDMIAVPDFRAGAMENWGLITYRESALLWDPVVSSSSNKQRVLTVIAHELAHQWFGNLVTPKWWDDLWLNEGFASFMEYVGADHVEPSWKMLEQFIVRDLMGVFEMDSLKSSHPVSVPVNDPDEINEIFDSISYNKGSSIIRMMQHFLGESTFRKGLTNYLKEFSYKNANQDDLWHHLSKASKEDGQEIDVKSVMDLWTKQTGYPVLNVLRDYKANTISLTQKRFLMISKEGDDKDSQRWPLPLTFTSASTKDFNNTKPKSWFYKNNESVILSGNDSVPSLTEWIIFNVRLTSYYKANYDQQNWKLLTEQLHSDHGAIHASNRAQLIDDALDLARAGLLDYATSLNITYYLKKEKEYVPWEAANQNFQFLDTMLQYTAAYGHWKAYIHRLIVPVFESVGFEESASDSHLNKMLRAIAISWACNVGHLECLKKAHSLYKQWMDFPANDPIPPNLKRVISCWGIHEGGEKEWNFAFERYQNSNVASEKDILLGALACTKEVWLLGKYLNMTLDTSQGVRKQDSGSVFARVASSSIGRFLAFDFIRDKWLEIKALYGSGFFEISRMVQTVTASLNTKFQLKQLKEFIGDHKGELGTATRTFQQSLEETEANVKWMEQSYDKVSQWLKNNK